MAYGLHLRKLAIRARPSAWLFSGWNCVPARLSRRDRRRHRPAIVGDRQHLVASLRHRDGRSARNRRAGPSSPVAMPANSGCWRFSSIVFQPICGIFSAGSAGVDLLHVAGDPAKTLGHRLLQPALRHQLHADADAEERPRLGDRHLLDRLPHAGDGMQARRAVGIGADAGQHDAVGGAHALRIGGQVDLGGDAGLARGALEGLGGRAQIARAVVDDGDAHSAASGIVEQAERRSGGEPARRGVGTMRCIGAGSALPSLRRFAGE